MKTTRRNLLKGGGKAVAAAAVLPLIASSATSSGAAGIDPFEYLAKEWLDRQAEQDRLHKAWKAAYDTLPKWARDGHPPTWRRLGVPGYYTVKTAEEFRDKMLLEIKDPDFRERFREESAERIAARRDWETQKKRAEDLAGETQLSDQCEAAGERMCEIEDRIVETPTASLLGIVAKLRIEWVYQKTDPSDMGAKLVKGALDGAEILLAQAGRAI